ncbi:TPA: hypothetical protein ACGW3M_001046 [Pseudomonas aeruginosa]|uniref:hypothetical protein n=1 Tax=Pseudomonas aeruginosa TaxID=287 RepID=UPI0027F4C429|nr:hypothetical protein [Pseudomonas aeruginosa]EKY4113616.1 hypothetical protein [Pseudomonas aeruginosa]ELJ2276138.1 hypothetical protein [Pseudomonas aeruginosa]HCH7782584.1 hypothetical protein [Pseudomonas aeruginosa]
MMAFNDRFYFVAHPRGDRSAVKVIDLAECVRYERSEFAPVNDEDFYERDEAIEHAQALAAKYRLRYEPFESRYDKELNESYNLTLD